VFREIKEDMAGIVEESKVRRKELAAAREKEGDQERGHAEIVRSKERKQQERKRRG
jgi:hypothetical protein